jgi:hypothetical protein
MRNDLERFMVFFFFLTGFSLARNFILSAFDC